VGPDGASSEQVFGESGARRSQVCALLMELCARLPGNLPRSEAYGRRPSANARCARWPPKSCPATPPLGRQGAGQAEFAGQDGGLALCHRRCNAALTLFGLQQRVSLTMRGLMYRSVFADVIQHFRRPGDAFPSGSAGYSMSADRFSLLELTMVGIGCLRRLFDVRTDCDDGRPAIMASAESRSELCRRRSRRKKQCSVCMSALASNPPR